ncbi:hydroxybutyrate-dimer hydrolase [Sphaerotilus hippei]|uniref:Hydroxybutyrate-dimer hydrolase n=1 Tax=Sphaerotilus hippei TaxID=744406 RepID=A0A318H716_9BURK|nr:3-hydroxybutyrate oligomer hydrolase family protein [Sphaerotilus hippei]PXW99551.1 hydroxybutyrate-dimer hydrolase [Sphaerotilus hippei]
MLNLLPVQDRIWARRRVVAAACCALITLGACGDDDNEDLNRLPAGVRGGVSESVHDGVTDDLLTAGLGKTGLMAAAPAYANAAAPTAAELRRNAIHTNYRALVDYTASGGMGTLYGPNVDAAGVVTTGEGRIAGREYIAWADDGTGQRNVTLMVQLPDSFSTSSPCIVTATSSGSRGIYGAIGTAGEWGLKRGCAVAYTDKGTGNGLHDPVSGLVMKRDGTTTTAAAAGLDAVFRLPDSAAALSAFNTATPDRVGYKHAHSQQNPEKRWGADTLDAIRLAFYVINQRHGAPSADGTQRLRTFQPSNTLVIASSVSNGGGAALAAAEQDTEGLIDGVAVSEPNAQPGSLGSLALRQGSTAVATFGRPLIDYFTYANLFQPCAALSSQAGLSMSSAFWPAAYTTAAQNRCAGLQAKGLLSATTLAGQADEALSRLDSYGWAAEQHFFQQSHFRFASNSIAVTYINTYGRFSVTDSVCGYSMANTNAAGDVIAQVASTQAGLFASGNGVPPTSGVNLVYDRSSGGAKLDFLAVSPSTAVADFALDGALCLRSLATGLDPVTGAALTGTLKAQSDRVIAGVAEVQLSARLQGKPTVIVAGRSDTLLPVNHTARAYFGKQQLVDGRHAAQVRYYEVTHAQHFDGFIAFGALLGYDTHAVPLHPYLNQALDLMYAHLSSGAALPASQVVRTTLRSSSAQALTAAHVPAIATSPAAADLITMSGSTLQIPD